MAQVQGEKGVLQCIRSMVSRVFLGVAGQVSVERSTVGLVQTPATNVKIFVGPRGADLHEALQLL